MIPRILPILLFLSSLALPAQSNVLVSPRTFAGTMGGSKTYYPFTGSPFVHLQIHDDLGTAPKRINQLAFRAENHPLFKVQAFSAQVTLRLSTAAVASLHADPVFAKNHGPNLATVLNRATVKFPGRASTGPKDFTHALAFAATPFLHTGKGSLAWELLIHSSTGGRTFLDYDAEKGISQSFGRGGQVKGRSRPCDHLAWFGVNGDPNNPGNWLLLMNGGGYAANQPCVWMLGRSRSRFGPFPLPLSMAPWGGTGNHLYIAPLLFFAGRSDGSGNVGGPNLSVPKSPSMRGVPIYSQVIGAYPGNPAFPLVFSDGRRVTPPKALPVARVYKSGSATATAGSVLGDAGVVTEFGYR